MTDTQTIDAINRHLDQEPTDWTARLQLADLLEDAGRLDEARYQRWAVEYERAPEKLTRLWFWWKRHGGFKPALIGSLCDSLNVLGKSTRQETEADLMLVLIVQGWPAPGVE